MAEDKEYEKIPTLTRENHETWFRRYKIKLKGKDVFYVCEKPLLEHCKVATVGEITAALEELDITDAANARVRINIEKKAKYLKDEASALDIMFRSLSEDDQSLIDEYETAYALWAYLQKKYSQTDATTANIYMTKIQMFTFGADNTIVGAWDKLKDYRSKLGAADLNAKNAYNDLALLLVLVRALPKEYETTIDTLNAQSTLTVDDKLKHLEAKQMRLQQDEEHAHPAFKIKSKSNKYVPPHQRGRSATQDSTSSSGDAAASNYTCHLCQKDHFLRHCPYL